MSINDLKFHHPFTCVVAGMTSSGKTVFVKRLLSSWNFLIKNLETEKLKCLWCFNEDSSISEDQTPKNVNLINFNGIPTKEEITKIKPDIIVIDDQMDDVTNEVKNLFIRGSHHQNISVILIVQNLFNSHKLMRTINLNSHYIVLMKGIRNLDQIQRLGSQTIGSQLTEIFKQATTTPFSYLLIDFHPRGVDELRVRTKIFPEDVPISLRKFHTIAPTVWNVYGEKDEGKSGV